MGHLLEVGNLVRHAGLEFGRALRAFAISIGQFVLFGICYMAIVMFIYVLAAIAEKMGG